MTILRKVERVEEKIVKMEKSVAQLIGGGDGRRDTNVVKEESKATDDEEFKVCFVRCCVLLGNYNVLS